MMFKNDFLRRFRYVSIGFPSTTSTVIFVFFGCSKTCYLECPNHITPRSKIKMFSRQFPVEHTNSQGQTTITADSNLFGPKSSFHLPPKRHPLKEHKIWELTKSHFMGLNPRFQTVPKSSPRLHDRCKLVSLNEINFEKMFHHVFAARTKTLDSKDSLSVQFEIILIFNRIDFRECLS